MFNLGPMELAVILVLALLVFGPKKLPEIGKGVGQAMREFKRASRDLMDSFNEAMEERPRPVTDSYTSPTASADSAYPAHPPAGTTSVEEPLSTAGEAAGQTETQPHAESHPPVEAHSEAAAHPHAQPPVETHPHVAAHPPAEPPPAAAPAYPGPESAPASAPAAADQSPATVAASAEPRQ
jgi:sec-independent protein translocase protein TatA